MKTKMFTTTVIFYLAFACSVFARPEKESPETAYHRSRVQIALLLDTSNGMDGLINQAKATLWELVNEFAYVRCSEDRAPSLEIALYEYGNSRLSPRGGYIRQVLPFSSDLDEISEKLFSLSTQGGDEYCGQVIATALRQLEWSRSERDLRFVFIAGNEPFNQGEVSYKSVLEDSCEKGLIVNTIFCGDYQLGIRTLWEDGAKRGGGQYSAIDHLREIVHIKTPYDEVIIELNRKLNQTYIGYGSKGAAKKQLQAAQDANAMEMEEAVLAERAVSKSSGYYRNSEWDLVDAYAENQIKLSGIDKTSLPASVRSMDEPTLKKHLETQLSERRRIQKEIREVNQKREAYLSEQRTDTSEALESALKAAIRKQVLNKDYHWIK